MGADVGPLSLFNSFPLAASCLALAGPCSSSSSSTVTAFNDSVTSSTLLDLASFTGSGSIVGVLFGSASVGTTGPVTGASGDAEWSGTLTLIYTYEPAETPVPGPGTLLLLGRGMVAIGGAARRRGRR